MTNKALATETAQRIGEVLAQGALETAAEHRSHDLRFRPLGGSDSIVYEVSGHGSATERPPLVLKLHRPGRALLERNPGAARACAQREYDALSFLWQHMGHPSGRLTVPEPVHHFSDFAAVLMGTCRGRRLDHALRGARLFSTGSRRRELLGYVRECGEWLATFHQLTRRSDAAPAVRERIDRELAADLGGCRAVGLDAAVAGRAARAFTECSEGFLARLQAGVSRHCDFGPHNAFVSTAGVMVIDLEGMGPGIVYDDLCYFLGCLESMPFYHLGGALGGRLRDAFLEGYARHGHYDPELIRVFMIPAMAKLMGRQQAQASHLAGWPDKLRRALKQRRYETWFTAHAS